MPHIGSRPPAATRAVAGTLALALGALLSASAPALAQVSIDQLPLAKQLLEENPKLLYDPTSVLVRFAKTATPAERDRAIASVGGAVLVEYETVPGLVHLEVGTSVERALASLLASPAVRYAEPDWVVRTDAVPNDPKFGNCWGLRNIGQTVNSDPGIAGADSRAHLAWDAFTGDPNFVIAIIDDGTNNTHPDLAANMWSNPGEISGNGLDDDGNGRIDDVWGWDFYDNDASPYGTGHGTHTAGTVGAVGNNGTGVAGVNWRCRLMALRFIGSNGGYTSDAILAIQYATQKQVKVSSNSWGGGGYSQGLYDAIAASRSVGHVFVAAAGNSGVNSDTSPMYPAAYGLDNVVSVAATDNNDGLASFSNYGLTSVDLGAPGVNVYSTYGASSYAYMNGTSMACPHVAGAAALVYAANPSMTYAQVRARILSTTRAVGSLAGKCATGGVLNVASAIAGSAANTAPTVTIASPASDASFAFGSAVTFSGTATDLQDGTITPSLVWTSSLQGALGTGGSFVRSDLVAGTHVITASATDAGSLTTVSTRSITIAAPTPPTAPASPSVAQSAGTVTIRWTDRSSDENGFEIERQRKAGSSWVEQAIVGSVGANVTTCTNVPGLAGTYRYRVRAFNDAGPSSWTAWKNVTVP